MEKIKAVDWGGQSFDWPEEVYEIPKVNSMIYIGNFSPDRYEPSLWQRVKDYFFGGRRIDFETHDVESTSFLMNDIYSEPRSNRHFQPVRHLGVEKWVVISWKEIPSRYKSAIAWLRSKFDFIDRYYTAKEDRDD